MVMVGTREQLLSTTCSTCGDEFPSRWQLHRHILATHLAPTTPTPPASRRACSDKLRSNDEIHEKRKSRSQSRDKRSRAWARAWSKTLNKNKRYRCRDRRSGSRNQDGRKSRSRSRDERNRSPHKRSRSHSRLPSRSRDRRIKRRSHTRGGGSTEGRTRSRSRSQKFKPDEYDNTDGEATKPLEEVTKHKKVERWVGRKGLVETTVVLTKGERDLVMSRDWARKGIWAFELGVKLSVTGEERKLVTISGSKGKVKRTEEKMSRSLSEGVYTTVNLDGHQKAIVIGVNGESLRNLESKTGAFVNVPRRGEGGEVIISGTPEEVKSAEGIIMQLTTRILLKLHDSAARFFLVGKQGRTIQSMQRRSGAQIVSSRGTRAGKSCSTTRELTNQNTHMF